MNCIICNHDTSFFFTKNYEGKLKALITGSDYYKCKNCGFTFSPTIYSLKKETFAKLNIDFHKDLEEILIEKNINQPPYLEQATMLNVLEKNKLIEIKNALDFAGGYGTLNKILMKYNNCFSFSIYDPYMQDLNNGYNLYITKDNLKQYDTVLASAIFEHVTCRETLEEINSCVSEHGVLIVHTVICENIPNDSNWFYINPVHCSFHTNMSMKILMKQWNYNWSIYCPIAKSWILFKDEYKRQGEIVEEINKEFQTKYLHYAKKGFVDYWKGF